MASTLKIVVGSHIWMEDKDLAWIDGEIFRIEDRNVHVRATNGKMVIVSISDIHTKDTEVPSNGIDDMTRLSYLHEPGVLNNLAIRYAKNIIYVSIFSLNYCHLKMIKAKKFVFANFFNSDFPFLSSRPILAIF